MTTKELLEVLSRTKTAQKLEEARNPKPLPPKPEPPPIDWIERNMIKNNLVKKYLFIFTMCFLVCLLFIAVPINLADSSYGKGVILGLPPILFMTASWVLGAWWAWDRDMYMFMALTLGMMPVRIGLGLMWVVGMSGLPGLNMTALVISMMGYWLVFTSLEIAMIVDFGNKVPRNGNQNEV